MFNTLRPRQNGHNFTNDIFDCIFLNKIFEFQIEFHWNTFCGLIDNMSALVKLMAERRPDYKPLSEPIMIYFTEAYMRHRHTDVFLRH